MNYNCHVRIEVNPGIDLCLYPQRGTDNFEVYYLDYHANPQGMRSGLRTFPQLSEALIFFAQQLPEGS